MDGGFFMETPIKMDDLGEMCPLFLETPKWIEKFQLSHDAFSLNNIPL